MWNLELHLEYTTTGQTDYHTFWHKVESVEVNSERDQWEIIARWKIDYNLKFYKHHYFICLSMFSEVVDASNVAFELFETVV